MLMERAEEIRAWGQQRQPSIPIVSAQWDSAEAKLVIESVS
jgi:hypothetical protein